MTDFSYHYWTIRSLPFTLWTDYSYHLCRVLLLTFYYITLTIDATKHRVIVLEITFCIFLQDISIAMQMPCLSCGRGVRLSTLLSVTLCDFIKITQDHEISAVCSVKDFTFRIRKAFCQKCERSHPGSLIGSCTYMRSQWSQNQRPWMTLNGRTAL